MNWLREVNAYIQKTIPSFTSTQLNRQQIIDIKVVENGQYFYAITYDVSISQCQISKFTLS